jgi:formamidopyrimidine-DNA glycosylase
MPELPEVTTTVNGLQRVLPRLKITAVWTDLAKAKVSRPDFEHTIKSAKFFKNFQKVVVSTKVTSVERRAKNILIHLNNGYTILIHMKMTGHVMVGKYDYNKKGNKWHVHKDEKNDALHDPYNRFIHFVCTLSNGKHLVLCDTRKFAKVTLIKTSEMKESIHLRHHGPEPLEKSFTFEKFEEALYKKKNGKVKITLMDPTVIAGIGNIYSDEMLWLAGIHPLSTVSKIPKKLLQDLYKGMREVLNKGIDFGGDSMSDYRDVEGKRGEFQNKHNAYRKAKEKCSKRGCSGEIKRIVTGGRSAHFCPVHQKLFS